MGKKILLILLLVSAISPLFASGKKENIQFEYDNIDILEVDASFLDVQILYNPEDAVSLETNLPKDRSFDVLYEKHGNRVRVFVKRSGFQLFSTGIRRGTLTLTVPTEIKLLVESASGNLSIDGLLEGTYLLKSSSGNIKIQDSTGKLATKTVSGNQNIDHFQGEVDLQSTSGNIYANHTKGNLVAISVSGKQNYNDHLGRIKIKSTSGRLSLADITGALDLKTVSGKQSVINLSLKDSSIFSSVSGDIDLEINQSLDSFAFDLRSLSGELSVGNREGKNTLSYGNGISILAESTSGDITIH